MLSDLPDVFAEILGLRTLDAVARYVQSDPALPNMFHSWPSDAQVFAVRLDGKLFAFREDPEDGYRSSCEVPAVLRAEDVPPGALAEFAPRVVMVRHGEEAGESPAREHDSVTTIVDERTGTTIARIGTEDFDDYYPSFVAEWTPPEIL